MKIDASDDNGTGIRSAAKRVSVSARPESAEPQTDIFTAWLRYCDKRGWGEGSTLTQNSFLEFAEGHSKSELARLRDALRKYGVHQVTCDTTRYLGSQYCTCGLWRALLLPQSHEENQ